MIRLRRGVALEIRSRRPGVAEIAVEVEGERATALAYEALSGPISAGDRLILNTTAVTLGLGTGGLHFVVAVEGGPDLDPAGGGRAMKLRYTPLQVSVPPVEETHRDLVDGFGGLGGLPIVVGGLHSSVTPVAVGAKAIAPGARLAYVMTEGGALPLGFSETVPALRAAGLLDLSVTCGQAFGGDLEAVNLFSGLAAARAVGRADLTVVAMGPGNLGTGSLLGFALLETGQVVNAVAALGGRPIVVPRLSFADPRERHRGVSHHTVTALAVAALASAEIALPPLSADRDALVRRQFADAGVLERHRLVEVDLGPAEDLLRRSPVPLSSMGRRFEDDPDAFRAAAAAGVLAARSIS
ncbi:MAG: DUF3866 family protein [Acidobacteria bacterium]|nr:DUF3866 family protein [Acidobacteriota bacterium]